MYRVLDLFSGIGGFTLGLQRAGGFRTVAFCEIDPFCRRVLAKHWPGVKQYEDVRQLSAAQLGRDGLAVDCLSGGFPCQDISVAGKGAGLAGERSGLWWEYARLIDEIRPHVVIIENVAVLRSRGLDTVLCTLATLGYDVEWHCIPASAVGAPHRRDRIWIVGHAHRAGCEGQPVVQRRQRNAHPQAERTGASADDAQCIGRATGRDDHLGHDGHIVGAAGGHTASLADADITELPRRERDRNATGRTGSAIGRQVRQPGSARLAIGPGTLGEWAHTATTGTGWWAVEPNMGRVVNGLSEKVDRRKRLIGLGNSVVPQIPELLGRAIMEARL